jgi:thymidylate synthase ThyX
MRSVESGVRMIDGIQVLPLDGLWETVGQVESSDKMRAALGYAGCAFYDEARNYVADSSVSLVGLGGTPIALTAGSRELMASSAAFSYLNNGEKTQEDLYNTVTNLGHFSIAHTVSLNILVAGISEGAEMELSLQRDLVHISKVTNARTNIQNDPPIVVRNAKYLDLARSVYETTTAARDEYGHTSSSDDAEIVNSMFPVNKATLLMVSADVSNLRKLAALRNDRGKERELRDIADRLNTQLSLLWPEIYEVKEN